MNFGLNNSPALSGTGYAEREYRVGVAVTIAGVPVAAPVPWRPHKDWPLPPSTACHAVNECPSSKGPRAVYRAAVILRAPGGRKYINVVDVEAEGLRLYCVVDYTVQHTDTWGERKSLIVHIVCVHGLHTVPCKISNTSVDRTLLKLLFLINKMVERNNYWKRCLRNYSISTILFVLFFFFSQKRKNCKIESGLLAFSSYLLTSYLSLFAFVSLFIFMTILVFMYLPILYSRGAEPFQKKIY